MDIHMASDMNLGQEANDARADYEFDEVESTYGEIDHKEYGSRYQVNPHRHVITGREMIEDDPALGYPSTAAGGFELWLKDVAVHQKAAEQGMTSLFPPRLVKATKILTKLGSALTGGQSEAVDSEGGFLVGPEHRSELLRKIYGNGSVFTRARVMAMTGKELGIPYIVESARTDGNRHGGVEAFWGAEAGTFTGSRPSYGKLILTAHKLHALGFVTEELDEDSDPNALQALAELFAEELSFKLDDSFIRGTGAGQPLGILNAACLVSITRDDASNINGQNILEMWARLHGRSRRNAVWFINQDIETDLMRLAVLPLSGGAGDMIPVWMPAGGISGQPFNTLMGREVVPIEQASTLGVVGDIILADMTQYIHAMRHGIKTAQSIHVHFVTDQVAFKATMRSDGQPWWQAALTPFQGTNTQSPFVVIAT